MTGRSKHIKNPTEISADHGADASLCSTSFNHASAQHLQQGRALLEARGGEIDRLLDDCCEQGLVTNSEKSQFLEQRKAAEDQLRETLASCYESCGDHERAQHIRSLNGTALREEALNAMNEGELSEDDRDSLIAALGQLEVVERFIVHILADRMEMQSSSLQSMLEESAERLRDQAEDLSLFLYSVADNFEFKPISTLNENGQDRAKSVDKTAEVIFQAGELLVQEKLEEEKAEKEAQQTEIRVEKELALRYLHRLPAGSPIYSILLSAGDADFGATPSIAAIETALMEAALKASADTTALNELDEELQPV